MLSKYYDSVCGLIETLTASIRSFFYNLIVICQTTCGHNSRHNFSSDLVVLSIMVDSRLYMELDSTRNFTEIDSLELEN